MFDPNKAYTVGVWDLPMYVYDHDEDDYVRNDDGTVALFNLPHYNYSYIGDDTDVDTLELRDKGEWRLRMMTLKLPKKQVNAILVALDAEIENQLGGRPVDWESFPEVAAMLMAYYTTRCKFDEDDCNG